MSRAPMRARHLALTLTAAFALLLALGPACAGAETSFGGLGRIGELTIRSGETKGDVELEEHDSFLVEPSTGDFYIADQIEGPHATELARVQKFDGAGKFLGQVEIKLSAAHEGELRAIALDAEKHKLYVLIDYNRETEHDANDAAAAVIFSVSTEVKNETLESTELVGPSTLHPESDNKKRKESLIEPAGLAVDPKTHDILISAQQDESSSNAEELHSVIQRVHENGTLGTRYVDSQNCLDEGTEVGGEPHCVELQGEQPNSLVVTQGGRALVEVEQAELWEIPVSANTSGGFKEEAIVPHRRFALPEGVAKLSDEEEQTGAISYVATGAEEGRIYASVEVSPNNEPETYGVLLLKAVEHAGELTITEAGWTGGQNKTSNQPKCEIPFSAEMPMEVGGTAESAITFGGNEFHEGGKTEVEPYIAKFGTGTGAVTCGHVEVTVPTVQIGNTGNLTEVPLNKPATLSSKVEGADALETSWKIVRRQSEGGKIESEEVLQSPEYLGRATSLSYTFKQAGAYEITETVTTDNLGTPTKQVVRKITAALPAITFKVEPNTPFPEGGVTAGTTVKLHVVAAKDPNEVSPKLKLTWRFSDSSASVSQEVAGEKNSFSAAAEHTFATNCGGVCVVTLEVKDAAGAEGHYELKVPMYVPPRPVEKSEPPPVEKSEPPPVEKHEVVHEVVVHNPEARIAGSGSLSVKPNGAFTIQVGCPPKQSECVGTVTLQMVVTQAAKKGKKPKMVKVVLARGNFALAGAATKAVALHLSTQGRSLLAHVHVLHATATFVAHDSATTRTTTAAVTLRVAAKKHAARH
jgi:hypothetical protein